MHSYASKTWAFLCVVGHIIGLGVVSLRNSRVFYCFTGFERMPFYPPVSRVGEDALEAKGEIHG